MKKLFSLLLGLFSLLLNPTFSVQQSEPYGLLATCFFCGSCDGTQCVPFSIYLYRSSVPLKYMGGQYYLQLDQDSSFTPDLNFTILGSDFPAYLRPVNPSARIKNNKIILSLELNRFPGIDSSFNLPSPGRFVVRLSLTSNHPLNYETMRWINQSDSDSITRIYAESNGTIVDITDSNYHEMDFINPVELSAFGFGLDKNNVTLNWTTLKEINNSGFEIERKDKNNEWEKIGFLSGRGNFDIPANYSFVDEGMNKGIYNYRLKQIDYNGNSEFFNLTGEVEIGAPITYFVSQNYPNPFNPETKIDYDIPEDSYVRISVFDIEGREIEVLVNEFKTAGYYTFNFNPMNFSSGIYFYKIKANNFTATKRMVFLK